MTIPEMSTLYGGWATTAVFVLDLLIRVGLSYRIIMRRLPVGTSLAWLMIVLVLPFVGAVAYVLVGGQRIGRRGVDRLALLKDASKACVDRQKPLADRARSALTPEGVPISRLAEVEAGFPPLPGNELVILDRAETVFRSLVADIDSARRSCALEFYIWTEGGEADLVVEALIRAAGRGVTCRVLVDALGSKVFLRGRLAQRLRDGGVRVVAALPVSLWSWLSTRADLRLHRKIVLIDGEVGYTGSQNLVDPRFFKTGAGVGEWVDAMVRLRGPAVESLNLTFLADWQVQTGESIESLWKAEEPCPAVEGGRAVVQVVPSGPLVALPIENILILAFCGARQKVILTTPYFVPDDGLLTALISTAKRGVEVTLVVPEKVDSLLVRYASRANQGDLLDAGVRIMVFRGGLLHTKSITIDDEISVFGSLNLDQRSFRLNFEISLLIYDGEFTARLRELQEKYIAQSVPLSAAAVDHQGILPRLAENTARLLGPLL